jgi:hypothetical protein
MAKLPIVRNVNSLANTIATRLADRAGLTHWAPDASARIISDIISLEVSSLATENREAFRAIQPSSATGADLEALASIPFGVQRAPSTFAHVNTDHYCLSFYTDAGTFGAINNGSDITIPAGTIISSEQLPTSISQYADYRTIGTIVLPKDKNIIYFSARAIAAGSNQNVGERTLVHHNFNGYTTANRNLLKVTNRYSILNGQDFEDDDRLLFKMSRQYGSLVQNNLDKIRLVGINVPGLEDVRVIPGYFGIGTAACFAFGIDEESNKTLADALQTQLLSIQGPGISLIAQPGVVVYIDIELRLRTVNELTTTEKNALERSLKEIIFRNIKNSSGRREVFLRSTAKSILDSHPEILSLVTNPHSIDNFEAVYLRKTISGSSSATERTKIIKDGISLEKEEFATLGTLEVEYEVGAIG